LTLAALAGGCVGPRSQAVRLGETKAVATRGDLRVITERADPHPLAGMGRHDVVCAEPSPDVALALSTTLSLEASGKTAAVDATGKASGSVSEAVLALAGRTTAVVALRDSLFRACEAYANGVIGRDGYGLILSQYGDLLVTLMLGEDAAQSARAGGPDTVATIAGHYMASAEDRHRAAAFVVCTMAAERARENNQPAQSCEPAPASAPAR
jgi:hypothetical protein